MASSSTSPLVAQSSDGSLIAIHHPVATSSNSSSSSSSTQQGGAGGVIRCYDGNVSSGSLKFTLRLPATSTTNNEDDVLVSSATKDEEEGNNNKFSLRKLIFISSASESSSSSTPRPTYLCGMRDVSSILLYDIERGVLASTLNIRNEEDNSNKKDSKNKKKKKRKSSIMMNGGVLCDIATSNSNTLYALIYFPTSNDDDDGNNNNNNNDESNSAKCRVYEYNLSNSNNGQEPRLVRKIKVGSVSSSSSNSGGWLSFGIHVSSITSTLIVKLGNVLRVIDLSTGSRVAKVDNLPSTTNNTNGGGGGSAALGTTIPSFVPLCVSNDGRHVITPVDNNRVVLLSYDKTKLRILTTLSTNTASEDAPIADIDMTYLDSNKKLVVSALLAGIAYIFEINLDEVQKTSLVPQMPYMPMIKLQTSNIDSSPALLNLVSATFHPRTPETTILCLFQRSTSLVNRGGSVAGSGITTLPMETVPYVGNKGTVIVGTSMLIKNTDNNLTDATKSSKKRKVEGSAVALTPGDQGREASMAVDLSSSLQTKKNKKGNADDDDDDDMENKLAKDDDKKKETEDANNNDDEEEMEEDGEQGQTIAERLALLSSAMEESDDDDDYNEEEGIGGQGMDSSSMTTTTDKSKFNTKSATSATLTTLLTQALSSNDPTQLNVALQVTDRRLVEGTVLSLQSLDAERGSSNDNNDEEDAIVTAGYIPTLMAHLVRRMARRHSLVMPLGVWVKAILAATARSTTYQVLSTATRGGDNNKNDDAVAERMAREGREMAMKLGPLKNFLNERVECFPQLLRLEGRLSLLNQQL